MLKGRFGRSALLEHSDQPKFEDEDEDEAAPRAGLL